MSAKNPEIEDSWRELLTDQFVSEYFAELRQFLIEEMKTRKIYPSGSLIFNAFNSTPSEKVKVVLLGQDPYHGFGQAHGLCFSVPQGVPLPPSLVNIFKELKTDLSVPLPQHGNLQKWAGQGVLLLNSTLTVRAGEPGSHQNRGWERFTDAAIAALSANYKGIVFMLWGKFAQQKEELIDKSKHHVLKAAHPSPFSAYKGFFGCRHFSKANQILIESGKEPIDWSI